MGERRLKTLGFERGIHAAGDRYDEQVAQVGAARAGEVCVTEAQYARIGIMIAGAGVPAFRARVGADLHESKRNRCARVSVPMPAGADQRQRFVHWLRRGPGNAGGHARAYAGDADKVMDKSSM